MPQKKYLDGLVLKSESVEAGDGFEGILLAAVVNKTITKTLACKTRNRVNTSTEKFAKNLGPGVNIIETSSYS